MKKILLITKNYPPQIGGIEKYSYDLYNKLVSESCAKVNSSYNTNLLDLPLNSETSFILLIAAAPRNEFLLVNRGKIKEQKKGIIKLGMYFFWETMYFCSELFRLLGFAIRALTFGTIWVTKHTREIIKQGSRNSDDDILVWTLDGSISWIGLLIKFLSSGIIFFFLGKNVNEKLKTRVTVHGTDIVWGNKFYQSIIPKCIAKNDEVYAISRNTMQECLKRGVSQNRISLVPHTSENLSYPDSGEFDKFNFLRSLGVADPENKIIFFSIGRWIERKGFHWFIDSVIPYVNLNTYKSGTVGKNFIYLLAGFGPMESTYRRIILKKNIDNVFLLGKVDDIKKARLFKSSDFFVMPNIVVPGDIEGFGLVLLEAQHYGLTSIVADIDGTVDASSPQDIILKSGDEKIWQEFISSKL